MSLITRRRNGQNAHESNLKQSLTDTIELLDGNKHVVEKLTLDVLDVKDILTSESDRIVEEIEKRADTIRKAVDEYVSCIKEDLKVRFDRNMQRLSDIHKQLSHELETCLNDKTKCEICMNDIDKDEDERLVSKTKVLELTLGSVTVRKYTPPIFELNRTYYKDLNKGDELINNISVMIGGLKDRKETIQEIKYPAINVCSFEIPATEVNAIGVVFDKGSPRVWINQGVSTELLQYGTNGKRLNKIPTDFKVNDICLDNKGKLLATSTDCYRLRCLQPMANGKHMQIYSITDKLYLHSVTTSYDGRSIIACGTDAPNYSNQAPNEVVIVEYAPPGKEIKRIAISDYIGKVYRFVQTKSNNYILTFPKDGKVLSVNGLNGHIMAIFDGSDFHRCLAKHINTKGDINFWPSGVCCNSMEQIFVTEWVHKSLFMLDKDCHFIRFIGSSHCCPNAVCYNDSDDTLWLGDKGTISVWKIKRTHTNTP